MHRFWLLTSTSYGTWLPGGPYGSVTSVRIAEGPRIEHDEVNTPWESYIAGLYFSAMKNLKCPPIYFIKDQAETLLAQFQETSTYRGYTLLAVAVMANHVHLVVGVPGDPDPEDLMRDYKAYGSRALNKKWGKPKSDTWWTGGGGSKRRLKTFQAVKAAIEYVRDQQNPLIIWLMPDWEMEVAKAFA